MLRENVLSERSIMSAAKTHPVIWTCRGRDAGVLEFFGAK
jgi:hypothetical protein